MVTCLEGQFVFSVHRALVRSVDFEGEELMFSYLLFSSPFLKDNSYRTVLLSSNLNHLLLS